MLIRTDPFREMDRLAQQLYGADGSVGTATRPTMMPMDAWRDDDGVHVELDLPGFSPDDIDIDIDHNVVTVRAERPTTDQPTTDQPTTDQRAESNVEQLVAERPRGVFSRQLVLGENLDTQQIAARYDAGVLRLDVPIAEQSKPRKITITGRGSDERAVTT